MILEIIPKPIRFAVIGVANTAVHAGVLMSLVIWGYSQATGNFIAFLCAASFSYIANGALTFGVRPRVKRYLAFVVLSGIPAYGFGSIGDHLNLSPIITLVLFSTFSYIVGYIGGKRWIFVE